MYLQVHNVNFSFDLMVDAGISRPKARPEGTNNNNNHDNNNNIITVYNNNNNYYR